MSVDLVERLDSGDPRALPRLLTRIENRTPEGLAALERLYPRTGHAHVVGVTGPPGSGKSTLVGVLATAARASGRRVAVVAVDPSSPLSGGAVLGDRVRMMGLHADPGVFIRSMASRGRMGGLAPAAAGVVHALDAAGFPLVLLETVGTGQDGVDIASLAQTVVVVQAPGLGDGVQAIKAGQLEIGDVLVVNKADLPGAGDLKRQLRLALPTETGPERWATPLLPTTATTGGGVDDLLAAIDAHREYLKESGNWEIRQRGAARAEVLTGLRAALERRLATLDGDQLNWLIAEAAARRRSPDAVVANLIATLDSAATGGDSVSDQRGG
ncbi:MAG: methylmalonyl Co-A mutase-associated GTPase MeaB [Thermomicrobiales bacterium]|nr:methylmalonyl Co-A mutase-associated GTPase MeaB [Thermomicrobiales bacterium]